MTDSEDVRGGIACRCDLWPTSRIFRTCPTGRSCSPTWCAGGGRTARRRRAQRAVGPDRGRHVAAGGRSKWRWPRREGRRRSSTCTGGGSTCRPTRRPAHASRRRAPSTCSPATPSRATNRTWATAEPAAGAIGIGREVHSDRQVSLGWVFLLVALAAMAAHLAVVAGELREGATHDAGRSILAGAGDSAGHVAVAVATALAADAGAAVRCA